MKRGDFFELKSLVHFDAMQRAIEARRAPACTGKFRFASKLDADGTIRRKGMHSYHYRHCRAWHIGSSNPVARAKRIDIKGRKWQQTA